MLNRIRRRIDTVVEHRVDARVAALLEPRWEQLEAARRDYEARLGGAQADFSYIRSEFDRIAPQLAALEHRFESLRVRLEIDDLSAEDALVKAQVEHERARLRLELVAHYEERLRRLEAEEA
ncbi:MULTISPECIES: hypothetical protein [Microbacterium]|uniref:hypothetical protein n=1 Tax=Microbacterium TaxID=33882 RepID=UPI0006FC2DDB|nr:MULTISPECIES: hypothetical protein [Microbacterium]KQR38823.1 hypothetical protein ASF80_04940 [Microbacterium sp. Leaf159]